MFFLSVNSIIKINLYIANIKVQFYLYFNFYYNNLNIFLYVIKIILYIEKLSISQNIIICKSDFYNLKKNFANYYFYYKVWTGYKQNL